MRLTLSRITLRRLSFNRSIRIWLIKYICSKLHTATVSINWMTTTSYSYMSPFLFEDVCSVASACHSVINYKLFDHIPSWSIWIPCIRNVLSCSFIWEISMSSLPHVWSVIACMPSTSTRRSIQSMICTRSSQPFRPFKRISSIRPLSSRSSEISDCRGPRSKGLFRNS